MTRALHLADEVSGGASPHRATRRRSISSSLSLFTFNSLKSVGLTLNIKELPLIKIMARAEFERKLPVASISKAKADYHAKRRPRPCGLTIHSAIGCPNNCIYCYIQDMGFDFTEAKPYGLTGDELLYALLSNPYFIPSSWGTFLAFGSIADPFNKKVTYKTLEYLNAISTLGNPCQFSTKAHIDEDLAAKLTNIKTSISPLITIITIEKAEQLEPKAPSVEERLETIRNLKRQKLKPILFLRPIIPGVTEYEVNEILKAAKKAGAVGVVVGGLRITKRIIERLKAANIDVKPIMERAPKANLTEVQIPIKSSDLKRRAIKEARKIGLIPFSSACCALAYVAGVPCTNLCWLKGKCTKCPNNCPTKVPKISERDVLEVFRALAKQKAVSAEVSTSEVKIKVERKFSRRSLDVMKYVLQVILRRKVMIKW